MIAYTVVSAICIAVMALLVIVLAVQFGIRNRAEKIEFIKSFKKGKCAVIYIVAVPLFFMANLYSGNSVGVSLFISISKAVLLVVLKYDVTDTLFVANGTYAAATYICLTLVVINAMMITVSILHQNIWKAYRLWKFRRAKTNKCIVIGDESQSLYVYDSCNCARLVADVMNSDAQENLYVKGISYKSSINKKRLYAWLLKEVQQEIALHKKTGTKLSIVVNSDEKSNLDWCGQFFDLITAADDDIAENLEIFVFGNREFEDIYSKYEAKTRGCLHYVNEYMLIALDFIDRFPLTEYMNKTHIDYTTTLVNPETQINVTMIGFGRTNQQIFLSMVANNQFLTIGEDGKIKEKIVNYHLFDRLHTGTHKNLNHNYFRYRDDFFDEGKKIKVDESKYLPLPEFPSIEEYHYLDINDHNFYFDLEKSIDFGERSVNYIIVSLGVDYESIDMANKIVSRLKEWKLTNTQVFVRIREQKTFNDAKIFLDTEMCHPFGSDKDVVFNYSHILHEKFTEMAIMRNYIYDIEHDMKHDCITEEERKNSRLKWYIKRSTTERESNIYACLSLREKLHLMGLDYCEKDDKRAEGLSNDMFMSIYANGDMPEYIKDDEGNFIAVRYSLDYKESRRKTMAIQEHLRWNAYMIMKGFVPSPKENILTETNSGGEYTNGKNYDMRSHGNLTTFDGLVTYRQMIAERDALSEESCDVIKYDYQLLDGAWWLLNKNGFKIIRRNV